MSAVKEFHKPEIKKNSSGNGIKRVKLADIASVPDTFDSHILPKVKIGAYLDAVLRERDFSIRGYANSIDMQHHQVLKVLKAEKNYNIDTLLSILHGLDLEISIVKKEKKD